MEEQKINRTLIPKTIDFVKQYLKNAEGGHDWWHIQRVWNNTRQILRTEKADPLVCELGALLHDIADEKFRKNQQEGLNAARAFLEKEKVRQEVIEQVIDIITRVSFSAEESLDSPKSSELMVVQDADRLDAIGAIGIARTFNYGGYKNRKLYDPAVPPRIYRNKEEYHASDAPTINHFYEKLLLLKDLMNTSEGKRLAGIRHAFMEEFLKHFFEEWEGK